MPQVEHDHRDDDQGNGQSSVATGLSKQTDGSCRQADADRAFDKTCDGKRKNGNSYKLAIHDQKIAKKRRLSRPALTFESKVKYDPRWIFHKLLDGLEESNGPFSIHDAVVV